MAVEKDNGIHSKTREQVKNRDKTKAQQYAEFAKLNGSSYVATDTIEEVDNYKMKVLE